MGLMVVLVVAVISLGGLAEIVPLMFQDTVTEPIEGLKPLTALQLEGREPEMDVDERQTVHGLYAV